MIRIISVIVLVILMSLIGCQPSGPAAISEDDIAAIEASSEEWLEAARAGDWEGLVAKYSEDAVFMPPHQPSVEGRDNIQAWFETLPPVSAMEFETVMIEGIGDLSYKHGTYTMTMVPEGSEPVNDSGKFIEIRRKQADGSWLITRDIFNSDVPLPEPE
jgi:uncharacterized protein (TIGR02246 family)